MLFLPEMHTVSAIIYDCDGVLTDNKVLVSEDGKELVFFNRSDGYAISQFKKMGIYQAIISTETNDVVSKRAEKLGIPVIYKLDSKCLDKGEVLSAYALEKSFDLQNCIFIGNDLNDLSALSIVGYPCAPADAEKEILDYLTERINSEQNQSGWISSRAGGCGVVRELYSLITSSK